VGLGFDSPGIGQGVIGGIVLRSKAGELLDQVLTGEELDDAGVGLVTGGIAVMSLQLVGGGHSVSLRSWSVNDGCGVANLVDLAQGCDERHRSASQKDEAIEAKVVSGDVAVTGDDVSSATHLAWEVSEELLILEVELLLPFGLVSLGSANLGVELIDSHLFSESRHLAS